MEMLEYIIQNCKYPTPQKADCRGEISWVSKSEFQCAATISRKTVVHSLSAYLRGLNDLYRTGVRRVQSTSPMTPLKTFEACEFLHF